MRLPFLLFLLPFQFYSQQSSDFYNNAIESGRHHANFISLSGDQSRHRNFKRTSAKLNLLSSKASNDSLFTEKKKNVFTLTLAGGQEAMTGKHRGYGHSSRNLSFAGPASFAFIEFALQNGQLQYPAVAIRMTRRAGEYNSSEGANGGSTFRKGTFNETRINLQFVYYFSLSEKSNFFTFGVGNYLSALQSVKGSSQHGSDGFSGLITTDLSPGTDVSGVQIGAMIEFRFNIPVYQNHILTFSGFAAIESAEISGFGPGLGAGYMLGYTFGKVKKRAIAKK